MVRMCMLVLVTLMVVAGGCKRSEEAGSGARPTAAGSGKESRAASTDNTGNAATASAMAPASSPTSAPASAPATMPAVTIFGLTDRPASVVFLVNHSATPTSYADPVRREMKRVIGELAAPTKVAFYVFSEDLRSLAAPALTEVSAELRAKLEEEYGRTDSSGSIENDVPTFLAALKDAVALKPEAIYLVTYSKPSPKLAQAVRELNKDARVRINVVALIADSSPEVEAALARIAKDSGGAYVLRREKDVAVK